jgi:hypothetical protein
MAMPSRKKVIMIISNIIGGLGNQMFQYSAAKVLSKRLDTELYLDISSYNNYKLHEGFVLNKYFPQINAKIASKKDILKIGGFGAYLNNPFIDSVLSRINKKSIDQKIVYEPHFHYWESFNTIGDFRYLKGYWQSYKYFIGYEDLIKKDFSFSSEFEHKNLNIINLLSKNETTSVHIRIGDYKNNNSSNSFHGILDVEYYYNSIRRICERKGESLFLIFSDDINWCKENFKLDVPHLFIDKNLSNNVINDFYLMKSCNNNIISNSSFSWWAAWLNDNKNKIVIGPQKWFNVGTKNNTSDLFLSNWERL